MTLLARFVLSAALAVGAAAPDFNPLEPISLDLKDASITDVITMLGALANTPVSIAPDVAGTISLQVRDVPYAKVLELIGAQNQLAIRFEGGKLVATRSQVPLPATGSSVPAPKAERPVGARRLSVEDYASFSNKSKPLFVQVRAQGAESCFRIDFEKGGGYDVFGSGSSDPVVVTQFGWDPVTGTRFLAVEPQRGAPMAIAVSAADGLLIELRTESSPAWSVSARRNPVACRDSASASRRTSSDGAQIRMRVTDGDETVMAPQVFTAAGISFSMRSGLMGVRGQHDETVIFGYLSADGKSVATALSAIAIRTDAADGREYVYSQVSPPESVRFTQAGKDPVLLAVLPAGPARDRPLELRGSVVTKP